MIGRRDRLAPALLAELVFTPRLWPDFGETDLATAIREFEGRERRFGGRLQQQHRDED